uniref:BTB domain-containing protein n=1 Tax=Mycena chlorophos TaxID=658473 RepID=A0ABQ0L257_MYCCL|nr:predicted protein [Mycena chlorophos]
MRQPHALHEAKPLSLPAAMASSSDTPQKPSRDSEFYFPDGVMVFQVVSADNPIGILFRLHPTMLKPSKFLSALFELAQYSATIKNAAEKFLIEGALDSQPILMPLPDNLVMADFRNLLKWIYQPSLWRHQDLSFWVSVLKLSTFLAIDDGINAVVEEFQRRIVNAQAVTLVPKMATANAETTLDTTKEVPSAVLRYHLSLHYHVDAWFIPAFMELLDTDITTLTQQEIYSIGFDSYILLTQAQAKIQKIRRSAVFDVPPLPSSAVSGCLTPGSCYVHWTAFWSNWVRQMVHHPDQPAKMAKMLVDMDTGGVKGVCEQCKAGILGLPKFRELFGKEEQAESAIKLQLIAFNRPSVDIFEPVVEGN